MSATKRALEDAASAVMSARDIPLSDVGAFLEIQSAIVEGSISLPVVELCGDCKGSGEVWGEKCWRCEGTGNTD